jgi:predicted RNA-binding protein with RPS1 domain
VVEEAGNILRGIVNAHGNSAIDDSGQLRAMLSDLPGASSAEIALVLNAVDAQIPRKLLDSRGTPVPLLQAQLAQDLEKSMFLAGPAARWVVQTWAFALNLAPACPPPLGSETTANSRIPELGERFPGTVVKITAFGAFVSLLPGQEGLLHVTQIRKLHGGKRLESIGDVIRIGDIIQVEISEIDERGKVALIPVEVIEREAAGTQPDDTNPAGRPIAGRLRRKPQR